MPSNHLILCRPLLLLPSIFPSIRVFSKELVLSIRWPKYWSFSFSFSPSNEYSGLISFRMDWLDLLAISSYVFLFFVVFCQAFLVPEEEYIGGYAIQSYEGTQKAYFLDFLKYIYWIFKKYIMIIYRYVGRAEGPTKMLRHCDTGISSKKHIFHLGLHFCHGASKTLDFLSGERDKRHFLC